MMSYRKAVLAYGVAVVLGAISGDSFAQLGLPKLGGGAPAPQNGANATMSQDQLVKTYAVADAETLRGQSKMAEALGLKDQAAAAQAKADALTSGATISPDTLRQASQMQIDVGDVVSKAQTQNAALSEDGKAKFSEGLGHLGLGLLGTVKLKDAALAFQQAAKTQITSASLLQKVSVTQSLAAGTYVATNLPGHIVNLGSSLKSAVSFAQSHNIPVPTDATAALSAQ